MLYLQYQHMLWFAGLRGAMAFALAVRNTVTEVRQLFFTTTCVITIATVIFNGGMTVPVLTLLEVSKKGLKSCHKVVESILFRSLWEFATMNLTNFCKILQQPR